jgi:hypothetical protein
MPGINIGELLLTAVIQSFIKYVLPILGVYIIGILLVNFVKAITGKVVFNTSIITGYSHRESTRRSKKAQNLIDLISSVSDIFRK